MDVFTQLVCTIGRLTPDHVQMLGTGFFVSKDGLSATTHHVTGGNDQNLVVLAPHISKLNDYQDMADKSCKPVFRSCAVRSVPER